MRLAVLLFLMVGVASGCGQRGMLYLRDSPPPDVKAERPAADATAPRPPSASDDTDKKR